MAAALANAAREGFLSGTLDWDADTIKVVLLDSGYTYNSAHDNLDDVTAGARIATSAALTGKTTTNGAADADDVVFSTLPGGDTITQFWIFHDTGVESTSTLIAFFDGFSEATNGQDVTVQWPNTATGIFQV